MTSDMMKDQVAQACVVAFANGLMRKHAEGHTIEEYDGQEPIRYTDPEKYRLHEEIIVADSHMMPSVTRFVALCHTLGSGFRAATAAPLDTELGDRKWLPACLELMAEDVLKVPENDWKTTLTIYDAQNMTQAFSAAVGDIINWAVAVKETEPLADYDMFSPLVTAIFNRIIIGHQVVQSGKVYVKVEEDLLLRLSQMNNLIQNKDNILALRRACTVENALADYRTMKCTEEQRYHVEVANLALEYDHAFICQQGDARIRMCHQFLVERFNVYRSTTDKAVKRAAFSFDPANEWFTYYVREYCTPTPWQMRQTDDPEIAEAEIPANMEKVDQLVQLIVDSVLEDSGHSPEAVKMHKAWHDIHALFSVRGIGKAAPTHLEQKIFFAEISEFFVLFGAAIASLDREEPAKPEEKTAEQGGGERINRIEGKIEELKSEFVEFKGRFSGKPVLSMEEAAQYCGVKSPQTIKNWEDKPETAPDGYPGRYDRAYFISWAYKYKQTKAFRRNARKKAVLMRDANLAAAEEDDVSEE